MRRIAIIDHEYHNLFIEDINEEVLERDYNGDEQAYIDDNYAFDGEYSWDYIVGADYIPEGGEQMEIDFSEVVSPL